MDSLPRLSKGNTQDALRTMAVTKYLQDMLKRHQYAAKAYLDQKAMEPGSKMTAMTENGDEIATISKSKQGDSSLVIADEQAFLAWCMDNIPGAPVKEVTRFEAPEFWTAPLNVAAILEDYQSEELPPGVEVRDGRAPVVTVRISQKQQDNIIAAFKEIRAIEALGLIGNE